jgi:hypothetical protein
VIAQKFPEITLTEVIGVHQQNSRVLKILFASPERTGRTFEIRFKHSPDLSLKN